MSTVGITHPVHGCEECGTQDTDDRETDKYIYGTHVEDGKDKEQYHQTDSEVPDVLSFEPFELDGTVDAFVDFINAAHDLDLWDLGIVGLPVKIVE